MTETLSTNNVKPTSYIERNTLQWQESTYPVGIDTLNDEIFEYSKDAIVRYSDGIAYISLVDNNVTEPTKSGSWVRFDSLFGDASTPTLPEEQLQIVMQVGNKGADVTLNSKKGVIQMSSGGLSAHNITRFKLINSFIESTDVVLTTINGTSVGASDGYEVRAVSNNGFANIILNSAVGYVQDDAVKINFRIIK